MNGVVAHETRRADVAGLATISAVAYLRRGNRDLARAGTYVWSLPALRATMPDGSTMMTCPNAGVCAAPCYARHGTYRFRNVREAHLRNLVATLDAERWTEEMVAELAHPRFDGAWTRIHDSGDFYSRRYAEAWCEIAARSPLTTFYAYSKEVSLLKALRDEWRIPPNLHIIYSLGGKEDHLVDRDRDRHADVFPTLEALLAAGYHDQADDDRLAVLGPIRVGIVANNIPHARKIAAGRAFGEWQASR